MLLVTLGFSGIVQTSLMERFIKEQTSLRTVQGYSEPVCRHVDTSWNVGFSFKALVQQGATYSPCMRFNKKLARELTDVQRALDKKFSLFSCYSFFLPDPAVAYDWTEEAVTRAIIGFVQAHSTLGATILSTVPVQD
ncbi:hypothetical protein Ciccas_004472 [Cichlidogyrus casuarinus]|uniref:Uncharacterized protein n=1 Tax=Cichlidogyrus casuarinus TaxID=1844966 RepID=A0ABD2QBH6_9PLAT